MKNSITYIYELSKDNIPFYIGKTSYISSRKCLHKAKYGKDIDLTIIDSINSKSKNEWKPIETYWINQYKAWGFDIKNQNEGGGGPEFHSKEVIEKMTANRNYSNMTCSHWHNEEVRAKIKHTWNTKVDLQSREQKRLASMDYKAAAETRKQPILQYKGEQFIQEWDSTKSASEALGIKADCICNNMAGRCKTTGGFTFKKK